MMGQPRRTAGRRISRARQIRSRIVLGILCLGALGMIAWALTSIGAQAGHNKAPTRAEGSGYTPEETPAQKPYPVDMTDWRMILVNSSHSVPEGYTVETQVADSYTGKELQVEAAQQYAAMKEAAKAEGIDLMLCSAYRSVEYQTGLFDKQLKQWLDQGYSQEEAHEKAATVVAIPGYSEHNTGLAADIVTPEYQDLSEGFEDTDAFRWLSDHAQEYGFILRYPKGMQDATGIIYEPWHYRYVGAENAKYINESGLCLEQFVELMNS